ncbi:MAG: rod shape-determining protein [Alphaproteobacteria bacterium]|nr:rod shape-determining protein [Alphaproteobacteria bacterium]
MTGAGWTVCVDFGTAASKAAAAPRDPEGATLVRPLIVALGANPFLLPAVLHLDGTHVRFGAAALRAAADQRPGAAREAVQSFKTLLGARDLGRALRTLAGPHLDPSRQFRQRDLIVLFLAYLLHGVQRGLAVDVDLKRLRLEDVTLRYTRPDWTRRGAAQDAEMSALFEEAAHVAAVLAGDLEAHETSIDRALAALTDAARKGVQVQIEGAVFEAAAAAACHLDSATRRSAAMIVLDVGAGTTDVGALAFTAREAWEIADARRTLDLAGDAVDRALMNLLIAKSGLKRTAQQAHVWRDLLLDVRAAKETLFTEGRATTPVGARMVKLTARDLLKDPDAEQVFAEIQDVYAAALDAAAAAVSAEGGKAITAVAAGGGARLPPIRDILRRTKPRGANVRVDLAPLTPTWAEAPAYGGALEPIFPMLAIAMGGAAAPLELVAM